MSNMTHGNGLLFGVLIIVASSCAGTTGPQRDDALGRNPHAGPPQAILRVQPVRRGLPFTIELAITGHPRYESLQKPVAVRLSILDGFDSTSIVSWGEPRAGRYFKWVVPAAVTREIQYPYITIHVAVHNLAGYTLTGKPILSEPFLWAARRVRVQHPVASSGASFGIHQANVYD